MKPHVLVIPAVYVVVNDLINNSTWYPYIDPRGIDATWGPRFDFVNRQLELLVDYYPKVVSWVVF